MGNCIRKESPTQWGGEEWGSFTSDSATPSQKVRVLSSPAPAPAPALPTGTQLKIKISKKQLDQILNSAHLQEVSPEQVLAQLLHHAPSWTPALRTIPE